MTKSSFGIRIEDELLEKLSHIMDESRYLNITRSEIIETLLEIELDGDDSKERIQELIIKRREGRLD
jgi:metal-responsive CopG/Arc/MetJ family transcriptional regulator